MGYNLPEPQAWDLSEIRASDADRASRLENAGSPPELIHSLRSALDGGDAQFGHECAKGNTNDLRAVIQFMVGADVFDWFFNARTGYRAQFRVDPARGLDFNSQIVDALRRRLSSLPWEAVTGRSLNGCFEDCGAVEIPKSFLVASLVPDLAKIWFCGKRIRGAGGIELLPTGVVGPKIEIEGNQRWATIYRDGADAWLELKGAFRGQSGPYQTKDPACRARKLHTTGEA